MSDILDRICADKRLHIEACKAERPLAEVEAVAKTASPVRGFANALRGAVDDGRYGLIAEYKKASPSKGLIRSDSDPAALARAYERGGASCLSVLTDVPYFQGHDDFLVQARNAVDLPVLRKDFMLQPYQVVEARALGADCILLIMAALEDGQAAELEAVAIDWGMDVLVEVHDAGEMERAMRLQSRLLGINNRNLKTMVTDLATTEELAAQMPKDALGISESGLNNHDDVLRISKAGCHCFLVGESLMRQENVEAAVRNLLNS
ncbi:MAG: indole-3-glycerol phosphate synthase TrpC [Rhodospirillaceae bacterium]|jgi:indole-3-glycerol phosphate synthase|nr:indole-3-glycerol phosphate synthase TrpC [Rhodospirillaceae bacterium]MBT3492539.1 indole-3-glycerol phosphate synthase TrpC [Rhodospirillaceae bacterium]MBT3782408.1 indole-3-glycerol phosphate synthase TrpC [Rhodospirillaceae bacterium]MBT3979009.1 indole-3-glycerol phosphate synthase TrpC [Rhodospirillaceae bacterium]MBT4169326.1 indole-3-glycerol phosphate synthase TrpC [Rhodospirillaceae bacterium]